MKFSSLIVLLFSAMTLLAEMPIIDSLKYAYATLPEKDVTRISTLEDLVEKYITIDLDSALYYSDILKSEINRKNELECNYYQLLGKIYKEQHNLSLFQQQSIKALECFQASGDLVETAKAKTELGIANAYQGKIKEASNLFNDSRVLFFELGDSMSAIGCSMHLGSLHMMLNERAEGLEKYFEAYEYYQHHGTNHQLAKLCNNIGQAYASFERTADSILDSKPEVKTEYYDKALNFFQKGLTHCKSVPEDAKSNILFIQSQILANIANVYTRMEEYDIGLGYLSQALKLSHEIKSDYGIATNNYDIAFAKAQLGKNYEALDAVHASIPISTKLNIIDLLVRSKRLEADILMALSQYQKAHAVCKECYEISKQTQTLDVQKSGIQCITKTSNALKIYKDAYIFQQEYISVNDSIQILAKKKEFADQQKRNQIEKDKALLYQKNELNELLLKKQKANVRIYSLLSFLSILGLGMLGFIYLLRGKHTSRIQEKNLQIESANVELTKVNDELFLLNKEMESTNQKLNNFTSVAAHDLKSPLRTISTYSQLLSRRNKGKLEEKDVEMLDFVSNSSKQLSGMIDDLLAFSKLDKDLGPASVVQISEVMETVKNNLASTIAEENVSIEIPKKLYAVKAHKNLLSQLFQNLIANGIKFRKENDLSVIKVKTEEVTDETVTYSITDNGIGIEPQYFDKIFTIFQRLNNSSSYEGSGIGLATCKSILDHYGQKIWLESEVGKGTSFYFTLPRA